MWKAARSEPAKLSDPTKTVMVLMPLGLLPNPTNVGS
jgi:hypothetical protein